MKKFYSYCQSKSYKEIFLGMFMFLFMSVLTYAQDNPLTIEKECQNNFSTEVIEISRTDDCITVQMAVYSLGLGSHALSHFMVEIPCGTVTEASNSEGWPVELFNTDPTSGITGLKIDDIHKFSEVIDPDTFLVSFTLCSDDPECLDAYSSSITVAYKASNCIFTEILTDFGDDGSDDSSDDSSGDSSDDVIDDTGLDIILSPENVTCYNGNDGAVYAEVSGGIEPYQYSWSNGSTSQNIEKLLAGTYSLIVTDSEGNSAEKSAEVLQPESPVTIEALVNPASCTSADGSIDITVTGGTKPYTFWWSNGDTTMNLSNAKKGSYIFSVTDALGCRTTRSFTITDNSTLDVSLTPNYLECYEEGQGEVISTVTGGTVPYSYSWSNEDTTEDISGVNSGLYNLTVTDAEGCTRTKSAYIGIRDLSISASIKNPDCYGGDNGEIEISGVSYGTPPYTYYWSTGDTTARITGLASGRYEVTVSDSMGCSTSRYFNVSDPPEISLSYSISPRDCSTDSDAEVFIEATGGSGSYEFFLGDSLISSPVILPGSGDYDIMIRDSNGCESIETIHIESPENINVIKSITQPSCEGLSAGVAVLSASGGTSPYVYSWSDGYSESSRTNLMPGEYFVDVSDVNGCTTSTSFTIDSLNDVVAEIYPPEQPACNSENNIVSSSSTNATNYSWVLMSDDNSWFIADSSISQMTYHSGNNTAMVIYNAWNEEGCSDSDTISITCTFTDTTDNSGDQGTGDGSGDEDGDGDGDGNECLEGCWETEIVKITPTGTDCYQIELLVQANEYNKYDLSHLVVGLDGGYITNLSNSANYKTEFNSTDPLSGVYGLKIDDISGFGYEGLTEFTINFEVCYTDGSLPEIIPVVYKAGTCHCSQNLFTDADIDESGSLSVTAYPNPFYEEIKIKLSTPKDTEVEIAVYDLKGNKIARLYKGILRASVDYTFPFNPENTGRESLFIYKVVSDDEVVREQILKIR